MSHQDIRIGTLAPAGRGAGYLRQIIPHGFESFQLTFDRGIEPAAVHRLADEVAQAFETTPNAGRQRPVISALGVYGNPLTDDQIIGDWMTLIDHARLFGCSLVCGFAGRIVNRPIDESMGRFAEVFGPLAQRAADRGVRLAFENCDMGGTWDYGDWNIAHAPRAWEMMFDTLRADNVGLQWEPCHQMCSLVDPLPQLRQWAPRVFHVHGKDATVLWDVVKTRGIRGGQPYVLHRTPGFGDTNWTDVISILRMAGFKGCIDIEGWHDPVYRDDLEMTGQVRALNYLKDCRGGPFVANPG